MYKLNLSLLMGCLLEMIAKKNRNGRLNFIRLEKKDSVSAKNNFKKNQSVVKNKSQKKNQISSEE